MSLDEITPMGSSPDIPLKLAATRFVPPSRRSRAAGSLWYMVVVMISTGSSRRRSVPIGTLLLLAVAGGLYVAMMGTLSLPDGGGAEDSLEAAIKSFLFTVSLWVMLAILLFAGGVAGEMPRREAIAAAFLTPVSGVAAVTAIDLYSRHGKWAIVVPAALPPLIALYALWARLPALHRALPEKITGAAIWGTVLALTLASFVGSSI